VSDVEQKLKDIMASEKISLLNPTEAQVLLDRLASYRKRLRDRAAKHDADNGKLRSKIYDYESTFTMARNRLDPERSGTCYSMVDQGEAGLLIKRLEELRGGIVAMRLLYGAPAANPDETLGVLMAAIRAAKDEEAKWRNHMTRALEAACGRCRGTGFDPHPDTMGQGCTECGGADRWEGEKDERG